MRKLSSGVTSTTRAGAVHFYFKEKPRSTLNDGFTIC